MRIRIKGGKLFKSREKRDEFLTPPCSCVSQGEPQAKLLGTFSLVRFFGVSKEMNVKCIEQLSFVLLIQLSGNAEVYPYKISPCVATGLKPGS